MDNVFNKRVWSFGLTSSLHLRVLRISKSIPQFFNRVKRYWFLLSLLKHGVVEGIEAI
jgi:hypothetical protein